MLSATSVMKSQLQLNLLHLEDFGSHHSNAAAASHLEACSSQKLALSWLMYYLSALSAER